MRLRYVGRVDLAAGSSVLITGANGGIGAAIARAFGKRGLSVVLSGRRREVLEPLAQELGGRVIVADLSQRSDVQRLVEEAGPVDVAILNAAIPSSGPITEFDEEQIDRALDVNLRAPIQTARGLVSSMVQRKKGHIVFISSISGKVATQTQSLYSCTKFGMRGFAFALREDLREHGVGVSTVFPGFIRGAGMFAETGVELPAGAGTRTPEQVANGVLRAIERDLAELDVAAFEQVLGGYLFPLMPNVLTWVQRRLGGNEVSAKMMVAQKHKR
ncbi:MAG: SDR family NAD(P)-dependent oxidoreductase [Deltaproteobacteria bacterium]|nr:SDR family NAD(P)-dependent oxidoreductase [Deltaproteobacteria bacterium]